MKGLRTRKGWETIEKADMRRGMEGIASNGNN